MNRRHLLSSGTAALLAGLSIPARALKYPGGPVIQDANIQGT
jgi:hypothetical protein